MEVSEGIHWKYKKGPKKKRTLVDVLILLYGNVVDSEITVSYFILFYFFVPLIKVDERLNLTIKLLINLD